MKELLPNSHKPFINRVQTAATLKLRLNRFPEALIRLGRFSAQELRLDKKLQKQSSGLIRGSGGCKALLG